MPARKPANAKTEPHPRLFPPKRVAPATLAKLDRIADSLGTTRGRAVVELINRAELKPVTRVEPTVAIEVSDA